MKNLTKCFLGSTLLLTGLFSLNAAFAAKRAPKPVVTKLVVHVNSQDHIGFIDTMVQSVANTTSGLTNPHKADDTKKGFDLESEHNLKSLKGSSLGEDFSVPSGSGTLILNVNGMNKTGKSYPNAPYCDPIYIYTGDPRVNTPTSYFDCTYTSTLGNQTVTYAPNYDQDKSGKPVGGYTESVNIDLPGPNY